MWNEVDYAVGVTVGAWFVAVILAPVTLGITLIPILPGFLLAIAIVGYFEQPGPAQNAAFAAIWISTTVIEFAPIVFGIRTAEHFFRDGVVTPSANSDQ